LRISSATFCAGLAQRPERRTGFEKRSRHLLVLFGLARAGAVHQPATRSDNRGGVTQHPPLRCRKVIEIVPHHGAIIPNSKANGKALTRKWTGHEPLSGVAARFRGGADSFSEEAAHFGSDAARLGNQALRRLSREVEHRPLVTLGLAVGVGILVGLVSHRRAK
jgi:ElaB/YqjD/DUF883 family membrane-anchored ribosome-binding protein